MVLVAWPLGVDADGAARWLVRVEFRDSDNRETTLVRGGDVGFTPSHGRTQWQTRARFGGPAAIVSTDRDGPLDVIVRANVGCRLSPVRARTDTRHWAVPRIVAEAVGPHQVRVGWFPRVAEALTVAIERHAVGGVSDDAAFLTAAPSSFGDGGVRPGMRYRYVVHVPGRPPRTLLVRVPSEPHHGTIAAIAGKAMWLSFSPDAADADGFDKLDPARIVAQAAASGLHALELRTTYGEFDELTPAARPTIDALVDAAAARGIAVVAWTVPRWTNVEDVAAETAAAAYRTPHGNGFAALAVDLERGDYFLGDGPDGFAALASYPGELRAALGPKYPLIATVEDPFLEHLTVADYPYATIAASVDALQPMTYWRMMSRRAITPAAVRAAIRASFAATRREAGRALPIDIGGQSSAEGPRGAPPRGEIAAAVVESRRLGALGITFFDWGGTSRSQFDALSRTAWKADRTGSMR
jgi:hypothetical protein